jgi:hypothetical protein
VSTLFIGTLVPAYCNGTRGTYCILLYCMALYVAYRTSYRYLVQVSILCVVPTAVAYLLQGGKINSENAQKFAGDRTYGTWYRPYAEAMYLHRYWSPGPTCHVLYATYVAAVPMNTISCHVGCRACARWGDTGKTGLPMSGAYLGLMYIQMSGA